MTYDEVIAHYEAIGLGRTPLGKQIRVWRRSEISNTDPSLHRGARPCMCGDCWPDDSHACPCGLDLVGPPTRCVTCGRPWWCER